MPSVSVIIPTYNRNNLVKEAIDSVLQQSFNDFEVIIIDDGSTDDTASEIQGISDNRIKYFYKENGGVSSARNLGLLKAQGKYIAFLDSDDLWPKDYLKTMLNQLKSQKGYGAAYTRVLLLGDDGKTEPFAREERYMSGWMTACYFKRGPCVMPSAVLLKRDVIEGFFFDEAIRKGEDNDAFLRLSTKTPFLFVPDTNIFWRSTDKSLSKDPNIDYQCGVILSFERFYRQLGENKFILHVAARQSISHKCRRAAKIVARSKNRTAALILLKRAIYYYPLDLRLYADILKAFFLSKKNDPNPNWQMPKPLPTEITINQKLDCD